jgi:hypothetical protein
MTIYRWKQDSDVIQRARWLSTQNEVAGDLVARREWTRIMEAAAKLAISGNVAAMKFSESRAWRKGVRVEQSLLSTTVSVQELFGSAKVDEGEELDEQQSEGDDR